MAKLEPVAIQIIGLEDMRRLSAALEQYNQNSPQQAGPLKNELAWFKEANANNLRMIDELHAQLDKSHDRIYQLEQVHDQQVGALTAARNNVDAFQRDLARTQADTSQAIRMLQGKRSATLTTNEVEAMLLREVSAVMRALESNSVTIRNLQDDHLVKNVGAERLRERLTEANDELAAAYNIIKNRNMRLPDSSYKTELLSAIADLVDRDVRREIGADHAETKQQLFIANEEITKQAREIDSLRAALRKEQKIKSFVNDECQKIRAALGLGRMAQAPEVLAAIDALQVDASMKQHTIDGLRGRAHDLEQTIAKAAPVESDKKLADALKMRLAEANDTIAKQADVIKHMHEEYHQLQALKQGADYDLERAKEEIAFAEAEAAKYKPLIEAVRGGFVYGFRGQWVRVNAATVAQVINGLAVSFQIPNSEDPQCL